VKNFIIAVSLAFSMGSFAQVSSTAGFKLIKVDPGSIYQQLGLKSGDIVKKVNGTTITSMEFLSSSLSKATVGDKVDLIIERKGKEETLHYTLK
jgi:general secretion pathway protein C